MKTVKKIFRWLSIGLGVVLLIFTTLVLIPEPEKVSPISPRPSTQYWDMAADFRIAYTHLEATQSQEGTLIFLHGGPGGYVHSSMIQTLEALTPLGYEVYLYDQRGSGLSDRMPRYSDVSFEKHLQDLHEIIHTQIGAKQVVLMGQSFGSVIAAHYSARYPEDVAKLIFSSPGRLLPYRTIDGQYANLDSLYPTPDSLRFIEPYNFVKDVNRTSLKPKAIVATMGALILDRKLVSDRQMDRMLNTLATKFTKGMVCDPAKVLPEEGGGGLYAYLATNTGDQPEIRDQLAQIMAPTLVLQGQCEYHSYSMAYEYADLYPHGRYQLIEGAGHEIWWEQKEVYIEAIEAFLGQDLPIDSLGQAIE